MPGKKKCPDPDFGWPDPDTFRVHHFKNSRANQKRASECLADWTVLGHAKVYAKIGFATHCNLGDVNPMISSLGNFQHFGLFRKFVFSITLGCILQQRWHLRVLKRSSKYFVMIYLLSKIEIRVVNAFWGFGTLEKIKIVVLLLFF